MYRMSPKVKSLLKATGNFLSTFVTTFVTILAVLFIVIKLLGWNMFSVDSSSMSPRYPVNTLVIVQKIEPEKIQPDDVITFVLNKEGVLVTHRVVSVNSAEKTFTTKGDANNSADINPVQWENTVGKVVLGIPWLGKPMRFLTAKANRPFVIAGLALLFVLSLIWDIITRKRKKKTCPDSNADETLPEDNFPEE